MMQMMQRISVICVISERFYSLTYRLLMAEAMYRSEGISAISEKVYL